MIRSCRDGASLGLLTISQIHFSDPSTYQEIYNMKSRWNKDPKVYHNTGETDSSFGRLSYKDAKERRDVLQRFFSRQATLEAQDLIDSKVRKQNHRQMIHTLPLILIF